MGRSLSAAAALLLLAAGCGKEPDLPPGAVKPEPPPAVVPKAPPPPPIAFIRDGNVWLIRPDGTDARALTSLEGAAAAAPAWSPDRSLIAFTARIAPEFTLYARNVFVVASTGGDVAQVTPVPRAGRPLAPDRKGRVTGRVVRMHRGLKRPVEGFRVTAFGLRTHVRTATDGRFHLMAPHGGAWVKAAGTFEKARLTAWRYAPTQQGRPTDLGDLVVKAGDEEVAAAPAWNPDGLRLAYQLQRKRADGDQVRLRRIDLDGSDDELLTDVTGSGIRGGPVLRAGALWYKSSDGSITMMDVASRRPIRTIQAGISVPDALAVSPDGRMLATLRFDEKIVPSIVLVRGGKPDPVVTFQSGDPVPHALDFSPDGTRLVMDRRTSEGRSDLWLFEIATRAFTRLTEDGGSTSPVWHGR